MGALCEGTYNQVATLLPRALCRPCCNLKIILSLCICMQLRGGSGGLSSCRLRRFKPPEQESTTPREDHELKLRYLYLVLLIWNPPTDSEMRTMPTHRPHHGGSGLEIRWLALLYCSPQMSVRSTEASHDSAATWPSGFPKRPSNRQAAFEIVPPLEAVF